MKKNKKLKFWLLGIAAFLIAVVFCLWPTQYYIEAPGEAFQMSKYVKSSRKANPNFYLVTVSERPAVMIDYLTSFLRPADSRYSKDELMGTSTSAEYTKCSSITWKLVKIMLFTMRLRRQIFRIVKSS